MDSWGGDCAVPLEFSGSCPLLQVFDMPASIAFYCDVLGFEVVSHAPAGPEGEADYGFALLRRKGVELMLNTAYDRGERPAAPDPARVAGHGDVTIYFGCEDLDGAYAELRGKGLNPGEPKAAWYGMRQMYLSDPDGYGLCFQWPVTQAAYDQWVKWYGLEAKVV